MAYSVIGWHYSIGGTKTGIGSWISAANQKGIPVGLKGADDAGLCFEGQQTGKAYSVNNWLIYRVSTAGQDNGTEYDVANYLLSPQAAAVEHFNKTAAKWPPELDKSIVWMEPLNEPRGKFTGEPMWGNLHPVDWLGWFMYEYALIANAQGFKVCGPSFNSGEPGDEDPDGNPLPLSDVVKQYSRPGMLQYLTYCAYNPDKAALAVHCYIWDLPAPQYPSLWGRFEGAIAAADLAGIPRTFNIFVSEFGYSPKNAPKYPEVAQDLDKYNQIAVRFPQVKFAAAWTLQANYEPVDSQIITWLNYPVEKVFDPGPQPAATAVEFGGTLPGDEEPGEPPMPTNLLPNASWELGWDNMSYGHIPKLWEGVWVEDGIHVKGEGRVFPRAFLPSEEWPLYYFPPPPDETSQNTYKFFKDGLPIRFRMSVEEPIDLPAGKYSFSVRLYPDIYTGIVNGQKIWSDDPEACRIRPFWNGVQGEWLSLHPYGGEGMRLYTFTGDHPGGLAVPGFQVWCPKKDIHNGVFVDDGYLLPVDVPDPPPPPPPADCEGLPRVQYTRRYNVIPPAATEQQAVDIFLEGWRRSKETTGGSYDDAGLGDLENKIANLYGIPDSDKQEFIDWFNLHYPGTAVNFLPVPGGEPPSSPFDGLQLGAPFRVPFVLTSPFNAPRDYGNKLHEGADYDITNPTPDSKEPVLCLYDGTVYRSENNNTAYGDFVVTKHENNGFPFFIWYCHMDARFVVPGKAIKRGDPVGELGATGGNWGEHIHINLQVPGFGLSGYVVSDVVDPAPFISMVPEPSPPTYQYNGPAVTFVPSLHAPGSDWEWGQSNVQALYNMLGIPVKWMSNGVSSDYYQTYNKPSFELVRVFWKPSSAKTAQQAWDDDIKSGVMAFYGKGARHFEVLNEPNLSGEGAGLVWDKDTFGPWLLQLCNIIKANCPQAKLYFPGMSPGTPWTAQFDWINRAWPVVKGVMDGFCLHSYTGNVTSDGQATIDIVSQVIETQEYLNLQVPLIVSESSVNRPASASYKAMVYKDVESVLAEVPGIRSVCWFISSWSGDQDINQESWVAHGIGNAYAAL